jgi:hypothetical protein
MPERIVTVTTVPTKILDLNPSRKEYKIQNQSTVTVYLGSSNRVSTTGTRKGRRLEPGVLEEANFMDDPQMITLELYGVVVSGSADLWVWEA